MFSYIINGFDYFPLTVIFRIVFQIFVSFENSDLIVFYISVRNSTTFIEIN